MPYATNKKDNKALSQLGYIVCHYGIKSIKQKGWYKKSYLQKRR
jgi:uncharacterized protein YutD